MELAQGACAAYEHPRRTPRQVMRAGCRGYLGRLRDCPGRRGRCLWPGFLQRLQQLNFELLRAGKGPDRHPRRPAQPLPEHPLPVPPIRVVVIQPGRRDRQHRGLIEHEYQPGQPSLGRSVKLQLGIRDFRAVPHR